MARRTKATFAWIVAILRKEKIPFMISGGLAARSYGVKRPLNDIDIEIPDDAMKRLLPHIRSYIVYGPARYHDESFDLLLVTLRRFGQEIDICGAGSQKLFDKKAKKWRAQRNGLSAAHNKRVFGLIVPVIARKDLLAYKSLLGRDVDREDVRQLLKIS